MSSVAHVYRAEKMVARRQCKDNLGLARSVEHGA